MSRYPYLLSLLLFFGLSFSLNAQDALQGLSGREYILKALDLSESHYLNRSVEEAAQWARLALAEAEKTGDVSLMARALNQEAKAMIANPDLRASERPRLVKKLERSNALNPAPDVRMANLKMLRQLFGQMGRLSEVREVEREIARLVTAQNQALEQELAVASEDRQQMEKLQASLEETLDQRESAIVSMTENQAKAELLLAQQKSILDSLAFLSMIDSLKLAQQNARINEQEALLREREAQLGMQRAQRNLFLALTALGILLALGLFSRYRAVQRYNRIIADEKRRSDELLLNILPEKVADELKRNGQAKAQFFDKASVLFVDFEGFSQFAASLSPEELVATLDYCFREFDRIIGRYRLEKIKTIGDAYMAAGGLPSPDPANPGRVVDAALEIKAFLDNWKIRREGENKPFLRARIGVHTGPLVAGVVGEKKFAYDIWGDTVNVASRMESSGESGRVNVSAATYDSIKESFICRRRGKIPTKNLGEMEMYFVEGKK
jgi:class 3 adenylate cyclase